MLSSHHTRRRWALAAALILAASHHVASLAQTSSDWPSGPIRFIVPFPAGSGTDVNARLIGERLSAAPHRGWLAKCSRRWPAWT